jgi:hypothetical protein
MDLGKFKPVLILCLSGFVLLNASLLWRVRDLLFAGYSDFASFYTGGKILQQHAGERFYDPRLQWSIQQEFASRVAIRHGPLPFIRPPFEALLFLPFAYFSYPAAYAIWTILKVCGLLGIAFLLEKTVDGRGLSLPRVLLAWLVSLAYFPLAFDLRQGQDSVLLLLIFCLALRSLQKGADFRSGIFLALGLFKFTLTLPVFFVLLLRRKFSFVFGFLMAAAVLLGLSIVVSGTATVVAYPRYLWALNQSAAAGLTTVRIMPNLRALFAQFGFEGSQANWVLGGITLIALVATALIWNFGERHRRPYFPAGFSLAIVVTLLTSYYVYDYDLSLLLIPILTLGPKFVRGESHGWSRLLFPACLGLLLLTPLYWFILLRFDRSDWIAPILLLLAISLTPMAVGESQPSRVRECPKR